MDDGPVTHGDVSANAHRLPRIPVKNSAVLDIAPSTNADLFQITARHSCGPEAAAAAICTLPITTADSATQASGSI